METYEVHQAKDHLSRILAKVQAGEEVLIAKGGEPIARIVPVHSPKTRIPDRDKGRIWVADDFDAPLPDNLLGACEGT
jgi:prevent-host-death family protein